MLSVTRLQHYDPSIYCHYQTADAVSHKITTLWPKHLLSTTRQPMLSVTRLQHCERSIYCHSQTADAVSHKITTLWPKHLLALPDSRCCQSQDNNIMTQAYTGATRQPMLSVTRLQHYDPSIYWHYQTADAVSHKITTLWPKHLLALPDSRCFESCSPSI